MTPQSRKKNLAIDNKRPLSKRLVPESSDLVKAADLTIMNAPQHKISLNGYAALSALMEQHARLYSAHEDKTKIEQAKRFPIKLTLHEEPFDITPKEDNSTTESMNIKKANATAYIDLQAVSAMHTLKLDQYLKYRLPQTIIEIAKTFNVMIWVGTKDDMTTHMQNHGIRKTAQLHAQNMRKFMLTEDSEGTPTLWISGFPAYANLKHLLLQLCYSGIDVSKIEVYGDLDKTKTLANNLLIDCLKKITMDVDNKILFIGSRRTTINAIATPSTVVTPYKIARSFELNDLGVCLDASGKKTHIIVLKIPQGEAAYDATKIFIEHGFNKIIMTGAGGNLSAKGDVGDYVLIDQAEYHGEHIRLNKEALVSIDNCPYIEPVWIKNITVDSPLDETDHWYEQYKNNGCVDVETFHIFKAITEAQHVKVIPGMFISDIVKKTPFFDLLSGSIVGKNIADFSIRALAVMRSITIDSKREKEIKYMDGVTQKTTTQPSRMTLLAEINVGFFAERCAISQPSPTTSTPNTHHEDHRVEP